MNRCMTFDSFAQFIEKADLASAVEFVSKVQIVIHAVAGDVSWFVIGSNVCIGGLGT